MKETVAGASSYSEYEPFHKVLEEKPGVCYGKNKLSLSILFTIRACENFSVNNAKKGLL